MGAGRASTTPGCPAARIQLLLPLILPAAELFGSQCSSLPCTFCGADRHCQLCLLRKQHARNPVDLLALILHFAYSKNSLKCYQILTLAGCEVPVIYVKICRWMLEQKIVGVSGDRRGEVSLQLFFAGSGASAWLVSRSTSLLCCASNVVWTLEKAKPGAWSWQCCPGREKGQWRKAEDTPGEWHWDIWQDQLPVLIPVELLPSFVSVPAASCSTAACEPLAAHLHVQI